MAKANVRVIKSSKAAKPTTTTPDGVSNNDIRYARIGRQCGELESDLNDVVHMAELAANAVEEAIGSNKYKHFTKNPEFYYLSSTEVDAFLFAIYHLKKMIHDHREAYYAAMELHGEGK